MGRPSAPDEAETPSEVRQKKLRTRVLFRWVCSDARSDEEVRVVGDGAELGDWDPAKGVRLKKSESSACWTSRAGVLLPLGRVVEYRYAICKAETGKLVRWETRDKNRKAKPTGLRQVLEDDGGLYRSEDADQDAQAPAPDAGLPAAGSEAGATGAAESSAAQQANIDLDERDSVMIVFPQLPMLVRQDPDTGEWQVSKANDIKWGVPRILHHFTQPHAVEKYPYRVRFLGQPGGVYVHESERKKVAELLAQYNCVPVWVEEDMATRHREFCEEFLWPVFHNVKVFDELESNSDDPNTDTFNGADWKNYQAVNNLYAEAIEAHGNARTLVWVHDYQLLLVPRYLFLRRPEWAMSFFLHSAFPSTEVLRCLPIREDILASLLSAKLVTFQIFGYMRHFISACSELMDARHSFQKGGVLQVEHQGRSVTLTCDHFVIPFEQHVKKLAEPEFEERVRSVREKFRGMTIIGSQDKGDRYAGLTLKLRIFHRFLSEYQQYQNKVVLIQYVTPVHSDRRTEQLARELEQMAEETNRAFGRPGGPPLVSIIVEAMTTTTRLAILNACDVLLDTSINDGLNLTPFMFYTAHTKDRGGVAIVSECCGCSNVLTGFTKVNPWNTNQVMTALDQALSMPAATQSDGFARAHAFISSMRVPVWVNHNMSELKSASQNKHGGIVAGLDAGFKAHFTRSGFRHLDIEAVLNDYRRAKSRAILLDNEGTICDKAGWSISSGHMTALKKRGVAPPGQVLDAIRALSNDRGNTVVVISGRDSQFLQSMFPDVEGLGLCAEYGFYWKPARSLQQKTQIGSIADEGGWISLRDHQDDRDDDWRKITIELMKQYVKRVQGSYIEYKAQGLTWKYSGVGASQLLSEMALEMARFLDPDHSQGVLYGYPVKVVCGKGYVEVKQSDVDKGTAVTKILMEMDKLPQPVDFVLCIGDDRSDEDMFKAVAKFFENREPPQDDAPTRRFSQSSMSSGLVGSAWSNPNLNPEAIRSPTMRPSEAEEMSPPEPCSPVSPRRRSSSVGRKGSNDGFDEAKGEDDTASLAGSQRSLSRSTKHTRSRNTAVSRLESARLPYYTATVGRKPSSADYFVRDVDEVAELLKKLASQAIASSFSRYASSPELAKTATNLSTFANNLASLGGVEEDSEEEDHHHQHRSSGP